MAIYKIDGFYFDMGLTEDGFTVGSIVQLLQTPAGPEMIIAPENPRVPPEAVSIFGRLVNSYTGHAAENFYADYGDCLLQEGVPPQSYPAPETPQDTSSTIGYVSGVLEQAAEEVGGRATTYDSPQGEESMPKTVQMFNALYDKDLTPEQGWQFMAILKMVRSSQGEFKRDNYVDEAAYAAFACKAAQDKANENG